MFRVSWVKRHIISWVIPDESLCLSGVVPNDHSPFHSLSRVIWVLPVTEWLALSTLQGILLCLLCSTHLSDNSWNLWKPWLGGIWWISRLSDAIDCFKLFYASWCSEVMRVNRNCWWDPLILGVVSEFPHTSTVHCNDTKSSTITIYADTAHKVLRNRMSIAAEIQVSTWPWNCPRFRSNRGLFRVALNNCYP